MTTHSHVQILVEQRSGRRVLEGIFRPQISAGLVRVEDCRELGSMISVADYSLMTRPNQSVALVIDAEGKDDIEDQVRRPIQRILAKTAVEGWIVTVASPGLLGWALTDPEVVDLFDHEGLSETQPLDRKARFAQWCQDPKHEFNRTNLLESDEEFRSLVEFLESYMPKTQPST